MAIGPAVALAAACGSSDDLRRSPAEPELRIWNPIVVRWEAGRPRHVDFAIENPTNRTLEIAAPDPASARVEVYAGPETFRVCGVAPSATAATSRRVALAPGDRLAVRVDLDRACGAVPPGEYRYVVTFETSYVAARPARKQGKDAKEGKDAFLGTLPAQYGQLLVAAPPAEVACAPEAGPGRGAEAARPARQGRAARDGATPAGSRRRAAGRPAPPEGQR